jgi:putative alpha-1,2-mannosidase
MKIFLSALICLLTLYCSPLAAQTADYTRWVNPFIGTGGHGHTFPGATVPFGMVQLSPDTRTDNWDGSSGYHYSDDIIYGFSHTHLSGTGIPDGCDILFMPTTGEHGLFNSVTNAAGPEWYTSTFSHSTERAEPGYYSVKLDRWDVLAELTSTVRAGLHRYTFQRGGTANIVLDLKWRDKRLGSEIRDVGPTKVEGFRRSSSWAKDQTVYFVAEFSKPYQRTIGQGQIPDVQTANYQRIYKFTAAAGEQILVKVAISYVSIEGARKNLEAELPGWDFDKVRADAKAAWNKELSKIEVSGGTPDQTTNFYTALYHTMIQPNVFSDVDGQYLGHDGKIHGNADTPVRNEGRFGPNRPDITRAPRKPKSVSPEEPAIADRSVRVPAEQYTVFSLWDTFRAAHPLYTIIEQKRTADFINTFIRIYEQGGRLPVWELWGEETDTMIGYHAVSVIADAMAKGIKGFDYEKAYQAAKHSAELDRDGLAGYKRRGYVAVEDENESVSRTLEYAYDDWCIMSMAATLYNLRSLNKVGSGPNDAAYLRALEADIERYKRRSGNFENLFDPETHFFRPRLNGGFVKPFAPQEVTFHFTEGNSWQYSFFVPHDVTRLIDLMGGTEKFIGKLDELFTTNAKLSGREQADLTGLMGQYAHGNEPSHHIAYLYNYAGVPSKTQARVRRILDEFYKNAPDGLIGNEDCGQMSAWYVLSASGFYPVLPGDERYDIGTPLFKQVTFNLENGKKFVVRAPNVSDSNFYIRSAKWNGQKLQNPYITQYHIMAGGVLELDMGSTPDDKAFPYASTATVYRDQPAVPWIDGGGRVFDSSTTVTLKSTARRGSIRYTLDGTEPTPASPAYSAPFHIDKTTTVRAVAFAVDGSRSLTETATFQKRANDWKVIGVSPYSPQYTGGGENAIVDGIRGTTNFASGEWQGVQGKPYEAIVDLKRGTDIREIGASFLQVAGPWIWMPANIKFDISDNGTDWTEVADIKTDIPLTEMTPTIKEFTQTITPTKTRYVRIRAFNIGKIPAWHPGAGGDPWIFIDEIFIR